MRTKHIQPAFTLVELLVVIGIVVVMIGILLPVFKKAREAGDGAVCMSNMRSYRQALSVYEAQNNGLYTGDYTLLFPSKSTAGALGGETTYVFRECPTYAAIASQLNSANINSTGNSLSYGQNVWLTGAAGSVTAFKMSGLNHSSEIAFRADTLSSQTTGLDYTGGAGLSDSFGFTPSNTINLRLDRPTFQGRHNGRGAVLWVDGHASLEAPVPVPIDGGPYAGLVTFLGPNFFNKNKLGYLVPPGASARSLAADYYFLNRKELISSTPPGQWFTVTMGGVFIPKPSDWR